MWSTIVPLISSCVLSALALDSNFDTSAYGPSNIINRDVAIIGGGSSGTHAAISLKDKGKSVIVIEAKGRLGGHTETYTDPATNKTFDYGVQVFHNISAVQRYLQRFDIPLTVLGPDGTTTANYDYRTGKPVNITTPSQAELGAALASYGKFLAMYPKLNDGMFLPSPVPEDLVMPFGEFAKKYSIENAVPIMNQYNPGLGDILTVPTIELVKVFGISLIEQFTSSGGLLTTARHNNSELYGKAQAELLGAQSLFLSSTLLFSKRTEHGVELLVSTPTGPRVVRAKKLLITIPPITTLSQPKAFDIDPKERNLFSKFVDAGYYVTMVNNTGTPDTLNIPNYAPETPYNIPPLPAIYSMQATSIPGVKAVWYGTPRSHLISDVQVKQEILDGLKRLQAGDPERFQCTEPNILVYSSHAPFYLQASAEDTKSGFYGELYGLQGGRSTWWTGASWRAQDSSDIWRFNEEVVLPGLLKGV